MGCAFRIEEIAGGFQMLTLSQYHDVLSRLLQVRSENRLSQAALETLAIVAYLQPITRPEIDEIRGVNSSGAVNGLLEKGLVEISGRKDAPGRPFLLTTTAHFLSTFGLNDLSELPELSPADADFQEQLRDLVGERPTAEPDPVDAGEPQSELPPTEAAADATA